MPGGPMPSTTWEIDYDASTLEVTEAKLEHDLKTWPRIWPASGPLATELPPKESWFKLTPERGGEEIG